MKNYNDYVNFKKQYYGKKFDYSDLSKQFVDYYENQWRIEIKTNGEIKRGRVGISTGWKPSFLLMLTTRSLGSSYLLSDKDEIIKVVSY